MKKETNYSQLKQKNNESKPVYISSESLGIILDGIVQIRKIDSTYKDLMK